MITDRRFGKVCYLISGTVGPLCYSIKVVEMETENLHSVMWSPLNC